MFVSSRRFERVVKGLETEIKHERERYWKLRYSHDLLLEKLGLYEEEISPHMVIRSKGGPEKSP